MPLLAQDPFWKPPNVHEVVGAVGVALGLLSIWLSWWLAKRDIRRRIDEAQRSTNRYVDRLLATLVQAELAEALRCLRAVRSAADDRRWAVAVVRADDAEYHLARAQQSRRLTPEEVADLDLVYDELRLIANAARRSAGAASGQPWATRVLNAVSGAVRTLVQVDARLRVRITETPDG